MNTRFLALLFLGIFLWITPAMAQGFLDKFEKEMPDIPFFAPSDFESKTAVFNETQFVDPSLEYRIRLPQDWSRSGDVGESRLELSTSVPADLIEYFGPPVLQGLRQRVQVQAVRLPYQMTARLWLIQYLMANNYSLLGFEDSDESRAEVLYVEIIDDESYVVRAVAQINGKNIIFLRYFIPVNEFTEENKKLQAQSVSTFWPIERFQMFAQTMLDYPLIDYATMIHPRSWELSVPKIQSFGRTAVRLLNVSEKQDVVYKNDITRVFKGQIDVELVSAFVVQDLDEELAKYNGVLADRGLVMGGVFETDEELIFSEFVEFAQTEVFDATDSGNTLIDYEFWVTVLGTGDYYILVTLLTPARASNFSQWAENVETYKVIATNISAQVDK